MSYDPPLPPGQATSANSAPVVIASDQSPVNVIVVDGQIVIASGIVTSSASGTQDVHVDNWPTVQTVAVQSMPPVNVSLTSGVSAVNVSNFPTVQTIEFNSPSLSPLVHSLF